MRKRIIIGLLAIVVIGVVAFVLASPRPGTIEYHVREYRALERRISERGFMERARQWVNQTIRRQHMVRVSIEDYREQEKHQAALINLGFLERQDFVLSNRSIADVMRALGTNIQVDPKVGSRDEFLWVNTPRTNTIVVIGSPEGMRVYRAAIQQADVPEVGK